MQKRSEKIQKTRTERDSFFKDNYSSPIKKWERFTFTGLKYFPFDERYYFELPLLEFKNKENIKVPDNMGRSQNYIRWGAFHFEINEQTFSLTAYKHLASSSKLWLPLKDKTSGNQTYGAGRYINLNESDKRNETTWIVDFNMAHNPSCAYNPDFVCPHIPVENILEITIEAGEKVFYL